MPHWRPPGAPVKCPPSGSWRKQACLRPASRTPDTADPNRSRPAPGRRPESDPIAIRLDIGCTRPRSMARFRWRAPYFMSVPSRSRKSFASGGQAERRTESSLAELKIRCCSDVQFDGQNPVQFVGAEGPEHHGLIDPVHELGGELAARRFHAGAGDLIVQTFVGDACGPVGVRFRKSRIPDWVSEWNPSRKRPGCSS